MIPLSDELETLRDAHRRAVDWGVWGGDAAAILSGPAGQETRRAMADFEKIFNSMYGQLRLLEEKPDLPCLCEFGRPKDICEKCKAGLT